MDKAELKNLIDVASGRVAADLVIKNCRIVNVYSGEIESGEIAIVGDKIAGVGKNYDGKKIIDAKNKYAAPGFIDAHIHIESSCISPEQLAKIIVPCGTSTIISDPHEIANVCGLEGLRYMIAAAEKTKLQIIHSMPSCVPATNFEDSGAILEAEDMADILSYKNIFGLGEFMNIPGVVNCEDKVLNKILLAKKYNKLIDGHAPNLHGKDLQAYVGAGILGDHECMTIEEMQEKISAGMYILIREGSACHNLRELAKGITEKNSRRILLCSDDRQAKTIFELGHMNNHLKICVESGINPVTAIQMTTLNTAEAFRLYDRGAIKAGLRADIVLLEDLENFVADKVFIGGELVAENGQYLPQIISQDFSKVRGSVRVKNFSVERLKMNLKKNLVNVINILPGNVVTKKITAEIEIDSDGDFIFNPAKDICKIAVVERHKATGKIGLGLLGGYGIKCGAVAISIAHDSHNIIVAGVDNDEMAFAVENLIDMEGGMVLVKNRKVIEAIPLPIAGIMSAESGAEIEKKLSTLHELAHKELQISTDVEPLMTLAFMSLPVIPEIKLMTCGLFDYTKFDFISIEA